jgi:Ca2+-binding RTX toxin-like protein
MLKVNNKIDIIHLKSCHSFLISIGFIVCIFSFFLLSTGQQAVVSPVFAKIDCERKETNIIIGTRAVTIGTKCNDVIVSCPFSAADAARGGCIGGNLLRGLENNDVLQGSEANDVIYGDEGNDKLTGGEGDDKLFGGPGNDILKVDVGNNLLSGGSGDDELYGGDGMDVFVGGKGVDTFDCGGNFDVVIDFDAKRGDIQNNNCEVLESYDENPETWTQPAKLKSHLDKFGYGTYQDMIEMEDIGEEID